MSIHSFNYMGIPVEYNLIRKKVKNINIHINEKCLITVSASEKTPIKCVTDFVESKADWILRNMAEIERYNLTKPDDKIYDGKNVFILGSQYVIKVLNSNENSVDIEGENVVIHSSSSESDVLKSYYLQFLKEKAYDIFSSVLNEMYQKIKCEGIPEPKLNIRNMKTRWGTCNIKTSVITLNLQLVKTDIDCIRQVAAHELVHFKVKNHGKDFYRLLEKYVPNWKELKKAMDTRYKDGI